MPAIGWVFIILALALIVGSLLILRDSAHSMKISDEKMKKIQARKAEIEAEESAEDKEGSPVSLQNQAGQIRQCPLWSISLPEWSIFCFFITSPSRGSTLSSTCISCAPSKRRVSGMLSPSRNGLSSFSSIR